MDSTIRSRIAGVVAIAVLATAGIVLFGGTPGPEPPAVPSTQAASAPPLTAGDRVTVHVSGAVADPGLVALSEGARVADAIAAVGGTTADADLTAVNLAAEVQDGERITVPRVGESPEPASTPGPAADGLVRINSASVVELQALPGVGPVLAQRIADHREAHGPFATVDDLLDVPGIGEAKLAALRDFVVAP